jgi:hypothetical protein
MHKQHDLTLAPGRWPLAASLASPPGTSAGAKRLVPGLSLRIAMALLLTWAASASALDYVSLKRDGKTIDVEGRLILTAQDGGILLLGRDGVLWNIVPEEQIRHTHDERPFHPFTTEQLSKSLLAQLPKRFEVYQTAHYLILHNTSRAYAQWCGSLFERLYTAFRNFWAHKGFELTEPEFPLVAIVFADKGSYGKYAKPEVGDAAESMIGYFNLATNRMIMYDLTGTSAPGRPGRVNTAAQINQVLASAEGSRTVCTIVHEATHQIAFNAGLHARYSDCPLWFSEGIAMYFETPDLRSTKGWAGVGAVNRPRLVQFHQFLHERRADSLKTLVASDKRLRDLKRATDAYAEAWALTYFLLRQRSSEYVEYLKLLSQKPPLVQDGPARRLEEFQKCFGDWKKLDGEFVRFMSRLR